MLSRYKIMGLRRFRGYMSFRPMPFQPFTLSTACLFDRLQFQALQIRPI